MPNRDLEGAVRVAARRITFAEQVIQMRAGRWIAELAHHNYDQPQRHNEQEQTPLFASREIVARRPAIGRPES